VNDMTAFEVNEELIVWAKEHIDSIPVGGTWSPQGAGVQYHKQDETTWALMSMYDHPETHAFHNSVMDLFGELGVTVQTPDGFEMVVPPLDPTQVAEQEFQQRQAIASGWACDCGEPLANFNLERKYDEYVETIDAQLDSGNTAPVELWRTHITCPACSADIAMEPQDYHLLAGDELYMTWHTDNHTYKALTRIELKERADKGYFTDESLNGNTMYDMYHVLGSDHDEGKVPPWMWGLMVERTTRKRDEEEE
tara:strand:+ start:3638 stop:4393 length:756 start_codon:yes stop_codon:yes gene_type:complete